MEGDRFKFEADGNNGVAGKVRPEDEDQHQHRRNHGNL
jgi:hypothetical protein